MPPNTTRRAESSTATDLKTAEQQPLAITKTTAATTKLTENTSFITPAATTSDGLQYQETINIYNDNNTLIPFSIIGVVLVILSLVIFLIFKAQRNPVRNNQADLELSPLVESTSQEQLSQGRLMTNPCF